MNATCVHCGADCGKHPVLFDNKPFCCSGCKTVYQILRDSNLNQYYQLSDSPGIKIEKNEYSEKFAYLDIPEIKNKLIEFTDNNLSKVTLFIPSIHCSSCIWLLENLQTINKSIIQSIVNFVKKEVTITFRHTEISLRQIVELLVSIHYIPLITLESVERKKNQSTNKQLLYKIGIAGFCFGNTMLISMPEYVPGSFMLEPKFKFFFGIINLLLALPVFFYCANDYLISAYKTISKKLINIDLPISIGIIAIFFESSFEILSKTGAGYMDSLCGLVFFLLIGKWYQNFTYQQLSFDRNYKSYFPVAITKIENSKEIIIPLKEIKTGDIIFIRNQELIPADSKLLKGKANIDYSFVTGESTPVLKQQGDLIYAGGKQIGNAIELEVINTVEQSKLTQLWNNSTFNSTENNKTDLIKLTDKVSKKFTITILLISFFTAIYWYFTDTGFILNAFSSVLIVACPCALALSIPFGFSNTMRIFGNNGFFLKKNKTIEKIAEINTIVFDKTGTITENLKNKINYSGDKLSSDDLKIIKSIVRQSTHPLSQAIYEWIESDLYEEIFEFNEIHGKGISAIVQNKSVMIGSAEFTNYKNSTQIITASSVFVTINHEKKGVFQISNQYREGVQDIIYELKKNNYEIHLLSGDNAQERDNLVYLFGVNANLHFNQSPVDKLNYIVELKKAGKKVLMVGDGLNDAGALIQSHVGITVADDIYHFTPACDAILEASKFSRLSDFIKKSKQTIRIVKLSFIVSFLYNIIGLYFAVCGFLSPIVAAILMPASSVTVVAFVTGATSLLTYSINRK